MMPFFDLDTKQGAAIPMRRQGIELARAAIGAIAMGKFPALDRPNRLRHWASPHRRTGWLSPPPPEPEHFRLGELTRIRVGRPAGSALAVRRALLRPTGRPVRWKLPALGAVDERILREQFAMTGETLLRRRQIVSPKSIAATACDFSA